MGRRLRGTGQRVCVEGTFPVRFARGRRRSLPRLACGIALPLLLAACGNPYALNLAEINYDEEQAAGVIQFTDPKLYKREALINERKDELAYLRNLLKDSADPKKVKFGPGIVREIETIQAFSASLGLKFDPAAGANFQRASEIADLKQDIEVTRLEMQLAQLQRDAQLLQDQLDAQEQAKPPPPSDDISASPVTSEVTAEDASKLIDQVEKLRTNLEERLDKEVPAPRAVSDAVASPTDDFLDRAAYRSTIKSAINAVSLDELHNKDGNSLFRVQLKATVLPGNDDYLDTLGVLRMEVEAPDLTTDDEEVVEALNDLYSEWLNHLNRVLNLLPIPKPDVKDLRLRTNAELGGLGFGGELFQVLTLEIPKGGLAPDETAKCGGVQSYERFPESCWYVRVAAPPETARAQKDSLGARGTKTLRGHLDEALLAPKTKANLFRGAAGGFGDALSRQGLAGKPSLLVNDACTSFVGSGGETVIAEGPVLKDLVAQATAIREWWSYIASTLVDLTESIPDAPAVQRSLTVFSQTYLAAIGDLRDAATGFLATVEAGVSPCRGKLLALQSVTAPAEFIAVLRKVKGRITVYDVAPTESAQRISTAARAADAIALAAAASGQLPTHGIGASGNFAYSRTATGKADLLERSPLVVGFAEPAGSTEVKEKDSEPPTFKPFGPAFGWILGPEIGIDPEEQQFVLRHRIAPYDLYADVSMPGWWPYFRLKAYSAWAPDWRTQLTGRTARIEDGRLIRSLRVPMKHNAADMDGLTDLLIQSVHGRRIAYPRIARIEPSRLSACAAQIDFQIWGENIWRASLIHIGGLAVDDTAIRILPDMRGVVLRLTATNIPIAAAGEALVTVWTQDGRATYPIEFTDNRQGQGGCAPPRKKVENKSEGPMISSVVPSEILACDPSPRFVVVGKNLTQIQAASLGTVAGTAQALPGEKPGTVAGVSVNVANWKQKIGKLPKVPLVIRSDKGAASFDVTIVESGCS